MSGQARPGRRRTSAPPRGRVRIPPKRISEPASAPVWAEKPSLWVNRGTIQAPTAKLAPKLNEAIAP